MPARRRPILIALLCLALGALTSVAVAMGIAALRPLPNEPPMRGGAFVHWSRPWHVVVRRGFGVVVIGWYETHRTEHDDVAPIPPEESVERLRTVLIEELLPQRPGFRFLRRQPRWGTFGRMEPPPPNFTMVADSGFGWPRLCLWHQALGEQGIDEQGTHFVHNEVLRGGYLLSGRPSSVVRNFRALPLVPIWSGLLFNTLFFALLWLIALLGPGATKRWLRIRRGCCASCGYMLRGCASPRCPECGEPRSSLVPRDAADDRTSLCVEVRDDAVAQDGQGDGVEVTHPKRQDATHNPAKVVRTPSMQRHARLSRSRGAERERRSPGDAVDTRHPEPHREPAGATVVSPERGHEGAGPLQTLADA